MLIKDKKFSSKGKSLLLNNLFKMAINPLLIAAIRTPQMRMKAIISISKMAKINPHNQNNRKRKKTKKILKPES